MYMGFTKWAAWMARKYCCVDSGMSGRGEFSQLSITYTCALVIYTLQEWPYRHCVEYGMLYDYFA